jgi:TonB family protein
MSAILALWLALLASGAFQDAPTPSDPPRAATSSATTEPDDYEPKPDALGIYKPGNGVLPPRIIKRVFPETSTSTRNQRLNGIVALSLVVDPQGDPHDVHILRPMADVVDSSQRAAALDMDRAALEAVKQYKFEPATLKGVPVPVHVNVEVRFFHTRK